MEKRSNIYRFIKIILILIILIVVFLVWHFFSLRSNKKITSSVNDIKEKLNIIVESMEVDKVDYYIEDGTISRAEYDKASMSYILKMSENLTDNLIEEDDHIWSSPIFMFVNVSGDERVQVISHIAEDNLSIMKAEWKDNDLYYSMFTKNLTTREDFLQEINRYILANHIS